MLVDGVVAAPAGRISPRASPSTGATRLPAAYVKSAADPSPGQLPESLRRRDDDGYRRAVAETVEETA